MGIRDLIYGIGMGKSGHGTKIENGGLGIENRDGDIGTWNKG